MSASNARLPLYPGQSKHIDKCIETQLHNMSGCSVWYSVLDILLYVYLRVKSCNYFIIYRSLSYFSNAAFMLPFRGLVRVAIQTKGQRFSMLIYFPFNKYYDSVKTLPYKLTLFHISLIVNVCTPVYQKMHRLSI